VASGEFSGCAELIKKEKLLAHAGSADSPFVVGQLAEFKPVQK
jgi:hypothetical protein